MFNIKRLCFISCLVFILTFSLTSVGAAKEKNIIAVQFYEIVDWDPSINYSDGARVLTNIYETLLLYDDGKFIPVLATSFEKSPDGKTWTFKLRKGVKFHNGEPFNAQAVKYSFDRTTNMGRGASWIFGPIKEIKVIDDYTVQFICDQPQPVDLMVSSYYGAYIMPPKLAKEKGSEWFQKGNACGTGPYKLKAFEKDIHVVLEKFDDYWGGWKPNQYDIAFYKFIAESSTAIQLLKRGEIDIIEGLGVPIDVHESLDALPDIEAVYSDSYMDLYYHFHNQKPPFDDVNVRKAVSHAVNVDEIIKTIRGKTAVRAVGPIPYKMWGHDPNLKTYDYDLEKAKQLMKQSKYADQLPIKITMTAYSEYIVPVSIYIQSAIKKIGIEAEINSTPWPAVWDGLKDKEKCPEMTVLQWWADYPTPSGWFFGNWFVEKDPLFGWSYYNNPEFEKIVNEAYALEATDREKATELYSKAQQILLDDAASLFICDYKRCIFKRKEVKGYRHLTLYQGAHWIYRLHK